MQANFRYDSTFRFYTWENERFTVDFPSFKKSDKFYGSSWTFDPMILKMKNIDPQMESYYFAGRHGYEFRAEKAQEIKNCIYKFLFEHEALELLP